MLLISYCSKERVKRLKSYVAHLDSIPVVIDTINKEFIRFASEDIEFFMQLKLNAPLLNYYALDSNIVL